jgi:hypothetical protein
MEQKSHKTFVRTVGRQSKNRTGPSRTRTMSTKLLTENIQNNMPQWNRSNTYPLQRRYSTFCIPRIALRRIYADKICCYRINTNILRQTLFIYLFIYLFMVHLTTLSIFETIQRRMVRWRTKWKNMEGSRRDLIWSTHSPFYATSVLHFKKWIKVKPSL